MKILHVADLHLDNLAHAWPDPKTGIPSSIVSAGRCWREAASLAVSEDVDAVVIAGDVFHTPSPPAAALVEFKIGLDRIPLTIPTFVIPGNHDRAPHSGQTTVLRAFQGGGRFVLDYPTVLHVQDFAIYPLPSISRELAASAVPGRRSGEDLILEALRERLGRWRDEGIRSNGILVGHWPIAGSMMGAEADVALVDEPMLLPEDLEGFAYVAMGHIHREQTISRLADFGSFGAYSGAIDRVSFSEEDRIPSALVVDLERKSLEWHDLPARTFVTLDYDTYQDEDLDLEGAIVRVKNVPPAEATLSRDLLAGLGAARVELHVTREDRPAPRAPKIVEATSPLEQLDAWLEARGVEADVKPKILEAGEDVIGKGKG